MKVKDARITILFSEKGAEIRLHFDGIHTFAEIRLTPEQVVSAFSRLSYSQCEIDLFELQNINKKMEVRKHEFPLPEHLTGYKRDNDLIFAECLKTCPDGWVPDNYFNSQDSFFSKGRDDWARTTIRRWVEQTEQS